MTKFLRYTLIPAISVFILFLVNVEAHTLLYLAVAAALLSLGYGSIFFIGTWAIGKSSNAASIAIHRLLTMDKTYIDLYSSVIASMVLSIISILAYPFFTPYISIFFSISSFLYISFSFSHIGSQYEDLINRYNKLKSKHET